MKRIICVLISMLILMTSACVCASANEITYVVDDEYTIIFENTVPADKQDVIARALICGDDETETYGLGCTLFGHDYAYTRTTVVQHKIFPTSPRCVEYLYDVTYCEDCDYTDSTLLDSWYIYCCPED